jgi:hypothetical protein
MKRNNIKSTWMMVRACKGDITVCDGFTDMVGRTYSSTSLWEWKGDGFTMMAHSMRDHIADEDYIPLNRIYGWSPLSGRPRKLGIREMLSSGVPLDAIKQAMSRA